MFGVRRWLAILAGLLFAVTIAVAAGDAGAPHLHSFVPLI
jgi:hypothetical protein